jgi:hypothetical protein
VVVVQEGGAVGQEAEAVGMMEEAAPAEILRFLLLLLLLLMLQKMRCRKMIAAFRDEEPEGGVYNSVEKT